MRANVGWSIRWRVSGVRGTCRDTTSEVFSSRSSDIDSAESSSAGASGRVGDAHAERLRARRHGAPDPSQPHQPELLATQLGAEHEVERPPLPRACADDPLALRQAPGDREDQRPREIGHRLGEHVGRIRDDHAARARVRRRRCCCSRPRRSRRSSDPGPRRSRPGRCCSVSMLTTADFPTMRDRSSSWDIGISPTYRSMSPADSSLAQHR